MVVVVAVDVEAEAAADGTKPLPVLRILSVALMKSRFSVWHGRHVDRVLHIGIPLTGERCVAS